jgi:two-component system, OmpR family, response regulator
MRSTKSKILVVDDDPKHLLTTKELLEMEGYEVVIHNTPFRTTEMVNTFKPDLVLLDVNMPALSGDKLCSLLRVNGRKQKMAIVLYSSSDEDSLRASVAKYDADGYVCKGDIAGLRRRIENLLEAQVKPAVWRNNEM